MSHIRAREYYWYCMADPGTAGSAFAVLFIAWAPWVPHLYILDEIYETGPIETTVGRLGPRIIAKCKALYDNPRAWDCRYDSAAPWFSTNFHEQFCDAEKEIGDCGLRFSAVEKKANQIEDGLDTINDMIERNAISISTDCPAAIWEFDNYMRDSKGRLPRKNDHQIDNTRYLIKTAGIVAGTVVEREVVNKNRPSRSRKRMISLAQDLKAANGNSLMARVLAKYGETP